MGKVSVQKVHWKMRAALDLFGTIGVFEVIGARLRRRRSCDEACETFDFCDLDEAKEKSLFVESRVSNELTEGGRNADQLESSSLDAFLEDARELCRLVAELVRGSGAAVTARAISVTKAASCSTGEFLHLSRGFMVVASGPEQFGMSMAPITGDEGPEV